MSWISFSVFKIIFPFNIAIALHSSFYIDENLFYVFNYFVYCCTLLCFNLKSIKNFIIVILLLHYNSISCIIMYYSKTNKRNHHFTQWKILGTTFHSFCSALSGIIFYIILFFIENFKYVQKQKEYHYEPACIISFNNYNLMVNIVLIIPPSILPPPTASFNLEQISDIKSFHW